jgi:hypothetical protein
MILTKSEKSAFGATFPPMTNLSEILMSFKVEPETELLSFD